MNGLKKWWIGGCLIFTIVILMIITSNNSSILTSYQVSEEESEKSRIAAVENAVILHELTERGNYSSYDATDSLVFFAYTEQAASVDAYNHRGEYQFTISLAFRERGSIDIRCEDNLLYIDSKYGNVFIFDGSVCIEKLSPDAALSKGYTSTWFQNQTYPIKIGLSTMRRYDEFGNLISEIAIPSSIIWANVQHTGIFCLVIVCLAVRFLGNRRKMKG